MKLSLAPVFGSILLLMACQRPGPSSMEAASVSDFEGIYVTDGYALRAEGYDWVGVEIRSLSDSAAHVAVRSRIDQKRATCTFDSDAKLTDSGALAIDFEDKRFLLILSGDSLQIRGSDEKSENLLYYFCSGGATLGGNYVRLKGTIDEAQLSGEGFEKELSLQGVTFHVQEINRGFNTRLIIEPSGLEMVNEPFTHRIYGRVSGAETEDLNSDGFPELMVYVRSSNGGVRTRVIGYSVNNGLSMSPVALPDFRNDPTAAEGYFGYDEFAIVETSLVQRFPVFDRTEAGFEPSGVTRQLQYRLVEGEASRQFIIEDILEY